MQPALLARGLRKACLAAGVRIFEHTFVQRIVREGTPVVHTQAGRVTAGKVVIATNAWSASLRELRRHLVAISSDIVATQRDARPARADRLDGR